MMVCDNRKSMAKPGARHVAHTDIHVGANTLCDLYIVVYGGLVDPGARQVIYTIYT